MSLPLIVHFHLRRTFNIRYAIGLELSAVMSEDAQVLTDFVTYVANSVTNGFIVFVPS
jgi:hypothetical protein